MAEIEEQADAPQFDIAVVDRHYSVLLRRNFPDGRWTGDLRLVEVGGGGGSCRVILELPRRYRTRRGLLRAATRYARRHRDGGPWWRDESQDLKKVPVPAGTIPVRRRVASSPPLPPSQPDPS